MKFKYIIMAGGEYVKWEMPRHLLTFKGERIIERTIRQLKEQGIEDISISSNMPKWFNDCHVPVLYHENHYVAREYNNMDGYWCNCFYPLNVPAVYLHGDVVFSDNAIKTIINQETLNYDFFASGPPFPVNYPKPYEEPFAWKIVDQDRLHMAQRITKEMDKQGKFARRPIAWEFWAVLRGQQDVNHIDFNSFVKINDGTCDIDNPNEIPMLERMRL